jgi:hypothetical protein
MALDDQIALTLYDRIFEVIGGSDPDSGLPSAFESATTMFVMAQRGMALNSKDFTNPFSPGNPSGSIEAAANIANLADVIPDENHMYSPKAGTVSDLYSKMVRGVKAHEPPPSPEVQAKRDELHAVLFEKAVDDEGRTIERPSVLADSEQKGFNGFQDAYMAYMGQFIAAQKDPALKELWPIMGAQALQRPKRAFLDWAAAGRDQIESTKAQLATLNEGQVARAFADAQFRLTTYELVNGTDTFFRTNVSPSDWADPSGSEWPEYSFSHSTFDSQHSAEATSWGSAANVFVGLWSFGGDVSHSDSRQSMSEATTDVGVAFKWRICPVYRKWMDSTLFALPNWDVGSLASAGGIAGGASPMMPLIPIAVVMVRDVRITANWSNQDAEHLDSATSGGASVGWGPFAVSGHYSHTSTSDTFKAVRDDQGFQIPTIQVLGFVCLKVPPCPPL